MTDETLKPCPFCGGEAVERWNTRAEPNAFNEAYENGDLKMRNDLTGEMDTVKPNEPTKPAEGMPAEIWAGSGDGANVWATCVDAYNYTDGQASYTRTDLHQAELAKANERIERLEGALEAQEEWLLSIQGCNHPIAEIVLARNRKALAVKEGE